jgi:hypothetical protein
MIVAGDSITTVTQNLLNAWSIAGEHYFKKKKIIAVTKFVRSVLYALVERCTLTTAKRASNAFNVHCTIA